MIEYSPINSTHTRKQYPACLLTGGLKSKHVQLWEHAKFAAEIRHQHDEDNAGPVYLKIDTVRKQTETSLLVFKNVFTSSLFFRDTIDLYRSILLLHLVFDENIINCL